MPPRPSPGRSVRAAPRGPLAMCQHRCGQGAAPTRTPRKATLATPSWRWRACEAIPRCCSPLHAAQGERGLAHSGRPGDHRPPPGRDGFGQLGKLLASADHPPPGHTQGYLGQVVTSRVAFPGRVPDLHFFAYYSQPLIQLLRWSTCCRRHGPVARRRKMVTTTQDRCVPLWSALPVNKVLRLPKALCPRC